MKLNINIECDTFEEFQMIANRLNEPCFNEMMENDRLEQIAENINNGETVEQAKLHFEQDINKKASEVEVKTEIKQLDNGLHLDGAPPERQEVTIDEVVRKARQVAAKVGVPKINNYISQFNVKKVQDLKKEDLLKVNEYFDEVLNA